ncbi:LLM class flavin-dependent oxidoreductase [Mycobacterium uberis]|uniref:LLM class flavin-dependent oxidoreductase n=1 Tax=Mycobacterium uberis TaxID=2162698 RepID=UPI000E3060EE
MRAMRKAQTTATLHLLTQDKAMLGISVGECEVNEPYGVKYANSVARFEEVSVITRALWDSSGELVSRESPFFPLHNALCDLTAIPGK